MIKIVASEVGREGSYRYTLSKGLYMDENRNIYLGGITGSTSYFSNGKIKSISGSEFRYDNYGRLLSISNTLDGNLEFNYYSNGKLLSILGDLFDGVDFSYNDEGRLVNVVGAPYGNRSMVLSYYPNGKIKMITNTEKGTVDFYWSD